MEFEDYNVISDFLLANYSAFSDHIEQFEDVEEKEAKARADKIIATLERERDK